VSPPDAIVTVDINTGRAIPQPQPWGWGVEYPTAAGPHRALFLDRARAERAAADLHGRVVVLFEWPPAGGEHFDWAGAV
jgi:hypothetical protein